LDARSGLLSLALGKIMIPAEEILKLAKDADAALMSSDSSGTPEIEAHCFAIVKIARKCPEQRPQICAAFQRILTEPLGAWEVLPPVMYLLRWPEMKEWLEQHRSECITKNDWRSETVYRHILEAFSDDWRDRDMYPLLAKNA
jgi:hypothetical protein